MNTLTWCSPEVLQQPWCLSKIYLNCYMVNMLHCHRYPLLTKLLCEQYIVYSVAIVPDVLTVHSIDNFLFYSLPPPHLIQGKNETFNANLLWIQRHLDKVWEVYFISGFPSHLSISCCFTNSTRCQKDQSWWLFSVEIFAGVGTIMHNVCLYYCGHSFT